MNALWEEESELSVIEATDIAQELLTEVGDNLEVRNSLLDLLLEAGRWSDAVVLINQYPDDLSEDWLWHTTFVTLQAKGPTSKKSVRALDRAVTANDFVLPLLLGDDMLTSEADSHQKATNSAMFGYTFAKGGMRGARPNAISYVNSARKFWVGDSLEWLRNQSTTGLMAEPASDVGAGQQGVRVNDGEAARKALD